MASALEGSVALVTGAGRNIGRAIALALAEQGADIVVNVRSDMERAEAVCEELRGLGVRALAVAADVADRAAVRSMFDRVLDELGPVSILVNNVGIRPHTPSSRSPRRNGTPSSRPASRARSTAARRPCPT